MESPAKKFVPIATAIIAFLWFYAAVSKIIDFDHFKSAMHKQTIWPAAQWLLTYGLPPAELALGTLLIVNRTVLYGLYSSAYLFILFIVYIILVLTKVFGKVPCSCGGLIEHMGWGFHLYFNIAFLILTVITIIIHQRKELGGRA